MLKIDIWPEARDFLDTLSAKHKRQVVAKIFLLAKDPFLKNSKQLEGYGPLRRFKAGDYRIVYFIERDILRIPIIDRRNNDKIYRRLRNLFK